MKVQNAVKKMFANCILLWHDFAIIFL